MGDAAGGQRIEVGEWLWSTDARAAARSELHRYRLPTGDDAVDDVVAETALRVLRRLERRGPIGEHPDGRPGVVPYARRAIATVVVDLVRGRRHRLEELVADAGIDVAEPDDPFEEVDAGDPLAVAHDLRRALHDRLDGRHPWVAAAALLVVTLTQDAAPRLPDTTPQPDNGDQGPHWAGLHHAGRLDCFERPDTGAVRNRRARAVNRVRGLLREAHISVIEART